MSKQSGVARRATFAALVFIVLGTTPLFAAPTKREGAAGALNALRAAAGNDVRVRLDDQGLAAFVEAPAGKRLPIPGAPANTARERALAFVRVYAPLFGLRGDDDVVVTRLSPRDQTGMEHVRMQQTINGVPVTGSSLSVHLKDNGIVRIFSKTSASAELVSTQPALPGSAALHTAEMAIQKYYGVSDATFSKPRLEILEKSILDGRNHRPARLAWFIEARRDDVREFLWIDARRGALLLRFSQLAHARNRIVYNANNTTSLPGTLVRIEGSGASGNADVDDAYDFTGATYDYFFNEHGRDSYDGAGASLISTVKHCDPDEACPLTNAFWNGTQMLFGDGYPADDVSAHELTHAVTEFSANLFYYMQSGALNESYSDIFGETVDLLNNADAPGDRWKIAEDIPIGAIRNMSDPNAFGDPAKMSDVNFFCDLNPQGDNGGVHINSGVPNKAYVLMVDGGTFNGFTVAGLGLTKAAKIQYRALTTYLDQTSNFIDNYNALNSSCADLTGLYGITTSDCVEVKEALDAVEMSDTWACGLTSNETPALCTATGAQDVTFFDLENAASTAWTSVQVTGTDHWNGGDGPTGLYWPDWPKSGVYSFWGFAFNITAESYARMANTVAVTADTRMQFAHTYMFENTYDGGMIEYSTNSGGSWTDAGSLITAGADYTGTIDTGAGVRNAFTGDSNGYTATQLNLTSLAGQNVLFRFYIATDFSIGDLGWFIDDIRIYRCLAIPTNVVATAASSTSVDVSWTAAAGAASYRVYRSSNGVAYSLVGSPTASPFTDTTASANTAYLYKVRAFNGSESPDSNIDLATTVIFTDPTLVAGTTTIKLAHFTELLTAVNAVRTLGGYSAIAFTAPTPSTSVTIRKAHLQDLRDGLHPPLSALDRALPAYTDDPLTASTTQVKKTHIDQLRSAVQ